MRSIESWSYFHLTTISLIIFSKTNKKNKSSLCTQTDTLNKGGIKLFFFQEYGPMFRYSTDLLVNTERELTSKDLQVYEFSYLQCRAVIALSNLSGLTKCKTSRIYTVVRNDYLMILVTKMSYMTSQEVRNRVQIIKKYWIVKVSRHSENQVTFVESLFT